MVIVKRGSSRVILCLLVTLLAGSEGLVAQEEPSTGIVDLMIGNTGVSFGNAPRVNGVRVNWSDGWLEVVNGINLTFWKPSSKRLSGDINGIALGVVAPGADRIRGIALTPGAVLAGSSLGGLQIGGLAVLSEGSVSGINLAGLAMVGQGDVAGISLGGLATVAQNSLAGISFGGLASVSQGSISGFSVGGLATVAQGDLEGFGFGGLATVVQGSLSGFGFGGLATVVQGDLKGISFGGLAVVGQGDVSGIHVGGVAVVGQRSVSGLAATLGQLESSGSMDGLMFAGYKIAGRSVAGINIAGLWTETENIGYLTVSGYNRTYDRQTGLTIGLFNHARDLLGLQIGLVNYVESNPMGLKILPFLNMRF